MASQALVVQKYRQPHGMSTDTGEPLQVVTDDTAKGSLKGFIRDYVWPQDPK